MKSEQKVRLWKKDEKGNFVSFARIFYISPEDEHDSINVQHIARLVKRGWIAYDSMFKNVNSKTPYIDFDFSSIDTTPLESQIKELDAVGYAVGKALSDFSYEYMNRPKYVRKKKSDTHLIEDIPVLSKKEQDVFLKRSIADYKAGKYLPPFILQEVLTHISNN